jgi:hypothetical protein
MPSSKFPFVLSFQLNEQQQLKAVRVSGTDMYSKQWACDSWHLYSAVGVGLVSYGMRCELLTASSVEFPEI